MGLVDRERQNSILEYMQEEKKATVSVLSEKFGASEATIRRDLTKLEKKGHLVKTYGGALVTTPTQFEFSYHERLQRNVDKKKNIGEAASKLVHSGSSIFLDSGTTCQLLAENIKTRKDLTVVTNGLAIAQILGPCEGIKLYLVGGLFRPKSQNLIGPTMTRALENFSVDTAFVSVDGFDPVHGFSAADHSEAEVIKSINEISKTTIVLADSSKGGKKAFAWICPLITVDSIITDKDLDKTLFEEIQQMDVAIELV